MKYEEKCWLDVNRRRMELKSKPIGFINYAEMEEFSSFTSDPENSNWYSTIDIKIL